jgi:hypothetical protein
MTIKKIEEVYLYISEAANNFQENIQATAFMEHSDVPFVRMMYNDKNQHTEIFLALNSWWEHRLPPISSFPFITYVEVHDDIPARNSPVKYALGLTEIQNFVQYYKTINVH